MLVFLAAMIQGNRANCSQFAASNRLDWLVDRLESQQSSSGKFNDSQIIFNACIPLLSLIETKLCVQY